jgi:hypothetical protein
VDPDDLYPDPTFSKPPDPNPELNKFIGNLFHQTFFAEFYPTKLVHKAKS